MKAAAFVVGSSGGPGAALMELARGLGFLAVLPFNDIAAAERQAAATPICFFLFAAVPDVRSLSANVESIRFATAGGLRFQPLLYFADAPSLEEIHRCVGMGFDDIITLPVTRARVEERIQRQVARSLVYYETIGYFGPDRRISDDAAPRPGTGSGGFRRVEIVRNLLSGISIVRDDLFEPEPAMPTIYL